MNGKVTVLGKYNVYIGPGSLSKLPNLISSNNYSCIVLITDIFVEKYCLKQIEKILPKKLVKIIIRPGEQFKNIATVQDIWQKLLLNSCDRRSLIINLGGGVILDIGGFAASTYMRGLDFLNIPTTLLAQVDASVGGKVGFDFAGIKNLIGTFNQPIAVICDINLLSTLPEREFAAGFAEIIKHGLIADKKYFEKVSSKHPLKFTKDELINIISASIKIKADIVQRDETENCTRKILNFGHTIGHAIESISLETQTPLLHGEAISIGMMTEARISFLLRMLSANDLKLIEQSLMNADLPISIPDMTSKEIINKMQSDKKNVDGKINFTLLQKIGKAIINQQISPTILQKALRYDYS
ncbi:3-dehydroquinate synthase [Candidatus Daviesbacteria bacterium RIFCSPLOWO2_02_FULL_36_7]|uniref:3-dehydroquinate synthase n=1 Tax=Candidatus Daviesbacteria bacterium RIFCSPLOWO2_02_FULL_36_7 TaxID=1797792 RepID=A0A1F5MHM4_9BACT|nr:MAG: 3-dehydroquinate synthase [Candidatus Daviesbacteria bacterium RIFCSPLOWO2_02_FULL_36_7]